MDILVDEIETEFDDSRDVKDSLEAGGRCRKIVDLLEEEEEELRLKDIKDNVTGGSNKVKNGLESLIDNDMVYSRNCLGIETEYNANTTLYGLKTEEAVQNWYRKVEPAETG